MYADEIRHRLGLPLDAQPVLDRLQSVGPPPTPVVVPDEKEAAALLTRLQVSAEDIVEMVSARPDPSRDPELWWLLERCCHEMLLDMGGTGLIEGWPILPGTLGRYLYVWVFLTTIPVLQAFHASRDIPEDITWASMAELSGQMFYHRAIWGAGGVRSPNWITAHFRGVLYRIDRLVYERLRIWFDTDDGPRAGDHAIGVHIPRGKLTPESCDESLARARAFFAKHFPDEQPCRFATCVSWVLDPQLADYLAADANIMQFQRRFQLLPLGTTPVGDQSMVESVFAQQWTDPDALPQTTSLERAIAKHLRAGGHWYYRTGWFAL